MLKWISLFGCLVSIGWSQWGLADELEASPQKAGQRHLMVIVGLPGDGEYRGRMLESVQLLAQSATSVLHCQPDNCHYFVGDEDMVEKVKSDCPSATVSTALSLREFFEGQTRQWTADDSFWLVMIGHTQVIDQRCYFNVQGKDFTVDELSMWMKPLPCRQQVNFLTMPVSGAWLAKLKAPGRVNIAAADGGEFTGTEYPYALANVLAGKHSHQALEDLDKDGRISLLDCYLAVAMEVHGLYKALERLPTEHAQLDDNGDGKAKEVQDPLIPIELEEGEEAPANASPAAVVITNNGDGALARSIRL